MLLLPLIGNSSAERSAELGLVQSKLRFNRVRYKSQIDLFNSQADEQERAQKARRKEEEERRVEKENIEAILEAQLISVSHLPATNPMDLNIYPTVLSPIVSPPEPVSEPSSRPTTPSVQFSPQASVIPYNSSSCSSHDLGCSSSDADLSPANSRMGSSSTDEGSSKLLITFGTFPAVRVTPNPRSVTVGPVHEYIGPSIPRSIPCGIADLTTLPTQLVPNFDPSQIRRNNSLLRPKSMGHILDQQLGRLAAPTHVRRVKKEKNVLNVLFSAPLAWRDRSNRLHPLEMLDYGAERWVVHCDAEWC